MLLCLPVRSGLLPLLLGLCALVVPQVAANAEKTIFVAPETIRIPHQSPTIADLSLDILSPASPETRSIRTRVEVEPPIAAAAAAASPPGKGRATWLLLDDLEPGRRYEVRVCWPATQPTAFTLTAHEVPVVWDTPELISSLSDYSTARLESKTPLDQGESRKSRRGEHEASVLLLQLLAAADYFTDRAELMKAAEPVDVEIILDPYLFNVLPQSLVPTVVYIAVVATLFWFVARKIAVGMYTLASTPTGEKKQQ